MAAGLMWCSYAELRLIEASLVSLEDHGLSDEVYAATMALLDKVRAALAIHERERA